MRATAVPLAIAAIVLAQLGIVPTEAAAVACTPQPGFASCISYTYSGADQAFVVPDGVTSVHVQLWGAGGGGSAGVASTSGAGGYAEGDLSVSAGQSLTVVVGQGGVSGPRSTAPTTSAYGGGGPGGRDAFDGYRGGGGGGRAAVQAEAGIDVVTAGGGGGSAGAPAVVGPPGAAGGGGGLNGETAGGNPRATLAGCAAMPDSGGRGGTQLAGGAGGVNGSAQPGLVGSANQGGAGGASARANAGAGGGGGGGYFGGGGGAGNGFGCQQEGAGGGGSGYVGGVTAGSMTAAVGATVPNASDPNYVAGVGAGAGPNTSGGNGLVVLQFTAPPEVEKAFSPTSILEGDTSTLTVTLSNPNNGTLIGTDITDALPASVEVAAVPNAVTTCPDGTVTAAPGGGSLSLSGATIPGGSGATPGTCTVSVTVTSSVVGVHTNTIPAGAITTDLGVTNAGAASADLEVLDATPSLSIVKSSDMADPATEFVAGHTVTYSFVVTNTSNVTVTDVTAVETAFSGSGTPRPTPVCPAAAASLAPGAAVTCSATYTITSADVTAGEVSNEAEARGTGPGGVAVVSAPSALTIPAPAVIQLDLTKSVSPTTARAGETVRYTFLLTNSGNRTLTSVAVTELAFTGSGAAPAPSCPASELLPGASMSCTADYTVTQADFDAQTPIDNTARAEALDPSSDPVASNDSAAVLTMAASAPDLTLVKTVTSGATITAAGQTVGYLLTATNSGDVTIDGLSIADTGFSGSGALILDCAALATTLAPAASSSCTATYAVTQADIDSGVTIMTNDADASGTDPGGATVSDDSTAVVNLAPSTAITLLKFATVGDRDGNAQTGVGDEIRWSFAVTNTGTTSVTDLVVDDPTAGPVTCDVTALAPQATATCMADTAQDITAADVRVGRVENTATATAVTPFGLVTVSAPASAHVVLGSLALTGVAMAGGAVATLLLLTTGIALILVNRRAWLLLRRTR